MGCQTPASARVRPRFAPNLALHLALHLAPYLAFHLAPGFAPRFGRRPGEPVAVGLSVGLAVGFARGLGVLPKRVLEPRRTGTDRVGESLRGPSQRAPREPPVFFEVLGGSG